MQKVRTTKHEDISKIGVMQNWKQANTAKK